MPRVSPNQMLQQMRMHQTPVQQQIVQLFNLLAAPDKAEFLFRAMDSLGDDIVEARQALAGIADATNQLHMRLVALEMKAATANQGESPSEPANGAAT